VDHGRVLPFSEVQCDQVRKTLFALEPTAGKNEKQEALGLAMARVVAHELYHVLASSTAHASRGLAKAVLPFSDLVAKPDLGFFEQDSRSIHDGFAQ
jgi:hypothetical protein